MTNPLLGWDALPPFSHITPDDVEPAVDAVLADNRASLAHLAALPHPDWESFVEPLETLGDRLHRAWAPAAHLNATMSEPRIRAAYNACLPKLADYETELGQDEGLYRGFRLLREGAGWSGYSLAQRKLIEDALLDFRLAGVALPPEQKARYRELMQELSRHEAKFEENLLDASQGWVKQVQDEARLAGIPEGALQQARQDAAARKLEGWVFTLDFPSYSAVITHADDRALRQELYAAFVTRASDEGPTAGRWDNTDAMQNILRLRQESARLTGFPHYAAYSLADKMAASPQDVLTFLEGLVQRVKPLAQHELLELSEFALERDGLKQLEPWDMAYYGEKLKEARYHVSEEMLRPYFPAPAVTAGLFQTMHKLYGISFSEVTGAEVWHPDVKLYALHDDAGTLRGHLYTDLYTRTGKRGGAWMDETLGRRRTGVRLQTPVAFLNCNFPPPLPIRPALLTHDDVVTMFHELGHCLHHLLTQVDYPSVGGINGVAWDAVELPSQFHENFAWTRDGLDLVSGHFETGQKLPEALYQKMLGARHFHSALFLLRQLEFALFDFRLHMAPGVPDRDFAQRTLQAVRREVAVVQPPAWNRFAHGFSHIFSGGYAAGYYSYLWAEVLAADAYAAFEEAGVFDRATGRRFMASILEQGGSRKAMELFVEFRGREPTLDAFLRLNGLAA
ncbi:MAG TPA: M3 family metallopeptidase [Gammaproteobacteria bacterium]|jgi:oligopeptidase A|nr:M3 family metallopeptidase [Gammaproteobacteria bacterium]